MNEKPSQGLLDLTRIVLEQIFSKDAVSSSTDEDMEVFSNVVSHHLSRLHGEYNFVLITRYISCISEAKALEIFSPNHCISIENMRRIEQEALHQLKEAVLDDLLAIMYYYLEKEDKE